MKYQVYLEEPKIAIFAHCAVTAPSTVFHYVIGDDKDEIVQLTINNDIHDEDEDSVGDILLCLLVYSAHRHCLLISTEN